MQILTDHFFPTAELLCHLLFLTAADCSCMAAEPCALLVLCKTNSTVCPVFTTSILSCNIPAVPSHPALCADLKRGFYLSSKLLMKVMNTAKPDQTPMELRTKELSLSLYFDSKLPVTTEPCFQSVWYFHLTMFLFLTYKKLCQKPTKIKIYGIYCLSLSMARITSSNDEIRCFDAVCSSESHEFSFQYLWIMAWVIFPVFFQELK